MPFKGKIILIIAISLIGLIASSKIIMIFAMSGLLDIKNIVLLVLSIAHFYFLYVKRYNAARFSFGFLLLAPSGLALIFFPYAQGITSSNILPLILNIMLTHIGVLLFLSKDISAYINEHMYEQS
ncbi:hypothetical protein LBMAG36_09060 [Chlorobiota bacterium]|nr:hypothetical protein LBMAG36_09060 [Chlorobiota bacterium]